MNIPLKISRKTTTHAKDQTRQCEQHVYICKSEQKSQCYNTNKIDLEKKWYYCITYVLYSMNCIFESHRHI